MSALSEFFDKQRQSRMEFYAKREEDLRDFAKKTLDDKKVSKASIPPPSATNRGKVESTFASTPLSSFGFEAPKGRRTAKGGDETTTATAASGAFCETYVDGGDTYIVGGNVSGGNGGSKEMEDYNVTGPTSGVLYVKVNVTAETADGVLLPGLEVNPASTSYTTTGGSNASLTAASPTGDFYVEIGRWAPDGTYIPTRCGHIFASGCPGNYQVA